MQRNFLAYHIFLVCDLDFTTPCWSATSSLLYLNPFSGGGGGGGRQGPLGPPQYANTI